jgi:formamidopyrimidine-DNA glycosylase
MPELPEVESIRRHLEPVMAGRRVREVEVGHPRMLRRQPVPGDFAARLRGRRIEAVGRHGKFLVTSLGGDLSWITHLGMSGRITLAAPGDAREPHTHVVVGLGRDVEVRFVDPRTFGFVAVYTPDELAFTSLARLGPDALDGLPPSRELGRRLEGRTAPIKPLLLDQGIVAGVGNIYADEALHRAGIDPHRPGGSLRAEELVRLRRGIKTALAAGLRWGGTTLETSPYLLPDGRAGDNLERLRAYGREDEPCPRCGAPIVREVLRQRSTFWCRGCQR